MLFNSIAYAIFLPLIFIIYWSLPHRFRWLLLFISSYYFYMSWNAKYVFLILFTTIISYSTAILLEKIDDKSKKKMLLYVTALLCLGVLFFFKYFNFLSKSFVDLMGIFSIKLNPLTVDVLLPVGISFYTFQTLSYVIDVYKGDIKAEKHFGYYATFISFFPQLVAGPIERTRNLLPQIKGEHRFDYEQATYGLKLMAWGFFKKLVIADVLSKYVQIVFNNPYSFHGFSLLLASLFFALQIYCDFSGYSDIAIGTAKLLGINLMTNFKNPYLSTSVKEFWSRWHISLSTWFRDYVYIPLGGNRVGKIRYNLNVLITFLVSGLWHGANWTFVIWGGVHGLAQILENLIFDKQKKNPNGRLWFVRVVMVFCFCTFAWIFFVAKSLPEALYVISHMFEGINRPGRYISTGLVSLGLRNDDLVRISLPVIALFIHDYLSLKQDVFFKLGQQKLLTRWGVYILLVLMVMFYSASGQAEFVYFQF